MRSRENPIRKTTTKGGNYRPTKSGAGMTKKGVAAYRRANPGSKLKKIQEGKKKITDVIDTYASGANPELKKKFRAGSKKSLDKISKIYKGDK